MTTNDYKPTSASGTSSESDSRGSRGNGANRGSETGDRKSGARQNRVMSGLGLCVFDTSAGRFALDVRLVGEVVALQAILPVPLAPAGVLGVFNLRGTPVALLDLATILSMTTNRTPVQRRELQALVLMSGQGVLGAALVDSVVGVVPAGVGAIMAPERGTDHSSILGFLATSEHGVVSVLDDGELLQRLAALRTR